MWDVPEELQSHLSHDRPCPRCGHGTHSYLACSDTCSCRAPACASPDDANEVEQVVF